MLKREEQKDNVLVMGDSNIEKWDEKRAMEWHLFMPPARPSSAEVLIYEHALQNEMRAQDNLEIVLLGSTPELRSISHQYGCSLSCVDFNATVFHILTDMVSHKGRESFYCRDWKKMDFNRQFDLVFGDGSINMVPPSKHDFFLSNIYKLLNRNGLAVLRVHVIQQPVFTDPIEVFQWYRKSKCKEPVFTATRNHLDMLWLNHLTQGIDFIDFHKRITELHAYELITDKEFNAYDRLLEFNRITLYYCKKEEFEQSANELFEIEQISYGNDHLSHSHHPIYYLRKKENI